MEELFPFVAFLASFSHIFSFSSSSFKVSFFVFLLLLIRLAYLFNQFIFLLLFFPPYFFHFSLSSPFLSLPSLRLRKKQAFDIFHDTQIVGRIQIRNGKNNLPCKFNVKKKGNIRKIYLLKNETIVSISSWISCSVQKMKSKRILKLYLFSIHFVPI